jgi:hypothetical protein
MWWHVDRRRKNWLMMIIVMIVLSIVAGIYASRGAFCALQAFLTKRRRLPTT